MNCKSSNANHSYWIIDTLRAAAMLMAILFPLASWGDVAMLPRGYTHWLHDLTVQREKSTLDVGSIDHDSAWIGCSIAMLALAFISIAVALRYSCGKRKDVLKTRISTSVAVFSAVTALCTWMIVRGNFKRKTVTFGVVYESDPKYDRELDTPENKLKYDEHCIKAYAEWSWPTDLPMPRTDAPQNVWESFESAKRKWDESADWHRQLNGPFRDVRPSGE